MNFTRCFWAIAFTLAISTSDANAACPGSPISNGTTADATQVMTWFNCKAPLDSPSFTGNVGIGMTPSNILDITQNQNGNSRASVLNTSGGSTATSGFRATNGTQLADFAILGPSFGSGGVLQSGYGYIAATTGISLFASGGPILFAANGISEVGRFGTDGSFLVGTTTNAGAGNISLSGKVLGQASGGLILQLGVQQR